MFTKTALKSFYVRVYFFHLVFHHFMPSDFCTSKKSQNEICSHQLNQA
jgi:hypothetical protein